MPEEKQFQDTSSSLTTLEVQAKVQRLQSLQKLMQQGGAVLSESIDFMVKARDEIHSLQQEQQQVLAMQSAMEEVRDRLQLEIATLRTSLEEAELKCANFGLEVARLRSYAESSQAEVRSLTTQLASAAEEIKSGRELVAKTNAELERIHKRAKSSVEHSDEVARLKAETKMVQAALDKAVASHRKTQAQLAELQAKALKAEILETKVSAMEGQISNLRATRTRLTEALKASDVKVRPKVESKAPFPSQ
jgi:chromosome segregation ATPase